MKPLRRLACVTLLGLGAPLLAQADGAATVQEQCAGCHALEQPDYAALGIDERAARKAPPLYYAGNKFRREWLVDWLQKPVRIRPAGVFPPAHVRSTPDGDVIDATTLAEHVALPPDQAGAVADYLMTLKPFDERIAAQTYEPGTVALRMGQMNFSKFKGCDACHSDAPDYGGVSGPELYTAWERLQPEFITAFISDPPAWDPHTLMPQPGLNENEVHKLANYLKALQEEKP